MPTSRAKTLNIAITKVCPPALSYDNDFICKRLAPDFPEKDGKQTPFRGHPVFAAQPATACYCRSCLEQWH